MNLTIDYRTHQRPASRAAAEATTAPCARHTLAGTGPAPRNTFTRNHHLVTVASG